MERILLAFRCFFNILFHGELSGPARERLGLAPRPAAAPPPPPAPRPAGGAMQMLAILQRDSRLIDFLMEDISGAADDQIGAAVREVQQKARESLARYVTLQPVIDGVEGTFTRPPSTDPAQVKFIGNVPATPPSGGTLRHKGWRAAHIDLPELNPHQDQSVVAPAEIEIE